MKNIIVDGYLNQSKLQIILSEIFGEQNIEIEKRVLNSRCRWDFFIKNENIIIEFDGDSHYRDALTIMRDEYKDNIAKSLNYNIIRIPYWIQLNNETLKFYFGEKISSDINIIQNYKHGFISNKAILPASFCELGIKRFLTELTILPKEIQIEIKNSLLILNKYEIKYILPKEILDYFSIIKS
jgi:hypothetical protein